MRHLKLVLTVIGAVTVLALAGNTLATATTGHGFLLGSSNSANAATSLARTTAGSALKLTTTSSSYAPLIVNGKGKVTNLNADTVDGLDSTQLAADTRVYSYTNTAPTYTTENNWHVTLAAGDYDVSWNAGVIPSGAGQTVLCGFVEPTNVAWAAAPYAGGDYAAAWLSGSGHVHLATTGHLTFFCDANNSTSWRIDSNIGIKVYVTKQHSVSPSTLATGLRVSRPHEGAVR